MKNVKTSDISNTQHSDFDNFFKTNLNPLSRFMMKMMKLCH